MRGGRPWGRGLLLGLVICLAVTTIFIAPSFSAGADASRSLALINSARQSSGLPPLAGDSSLNSMAQQHAQRMAARGSIYHSGFSGTGDARSWGENVGRGPDVDSVHRAFMSSSTHRANIMNRGFTHAGVGVAPYSGGVMVAQMFVGRAGYVAPAPRAPAKPRVAVASKPAVALAPPPPPPPPAPVAEVVGGQVAEGGGHFFYCGIRDIDIPPEEGG